MYRFLSNFWPCIVGYEGENYPSVEHAYQAAKTHDKTVRKLIREARSPGVAKRLGKNVELRPDWEQKKEGIMLGLLVQKFAHPELKARLRDTGDNVLIEGNTWGDKEWGAVLNTKGEWEGNNKLGKLLMRVREQL